MQSPGCAPPASMPSSTKHGEAPCTCGARAPHGTRRFPAIRVCPSPGARDSSGASGTGTGRLAGQRRAARSQLGGQPGPGGDEGWPVPGQAASFDQRDPPAREHLRSVAGAERIGLVGQDDEVGPVRREVVEADVRVPVGVIAVDVAEAEPGGDVTGEGGRSQGSRQIGMAARMRGPGGWLRPTRSATAPGRLSGARGGLPGAGGRDHRGSAPGRSCRHDAIPLPATPGRVIG